MTGLNPRTPSPLLLDGRRIILVGLGGIGSWLAKLLVTYLSSLRESSIELFLVDGDDFEERNRDRMEVPDLGNKAEVTSAELTEAHGRPKLYLRPIPEYVTAENVGDIIEEGDIVLACVDNHATRKILSDHAETLDDVLLISGGNDGVEGDLTGTYGNVQLYRREGGRERNPPLTRFHPEIADPADEVPGPSCADLAATSAPQIVFTNHVAAAVMGTVFFNFVTGGGESRYDEVCFDLEEARTVPRLF